MSVLHTHDKTCWQLEEVVDQPTGALQLKFVCSVTGVVDRAALTLQDDRLTDKQRKQLLNTPDWNDVCLLTRVMRQPVAMRHFISRALTQVLDVVGTDVTSEHKSWLMLPVDACDAELLVLVFVGLMSVHSAFAQFVVMKSSRLFDGDVLLSYFRSMLRMLEIVPVTELTAAACLRSWVGELTHTITMRDVVFMRQNVIPCYVIEGADDHPFKCIVPFPTPVKLPEKGEQEPAYIPSTTFSEGNDQTRAHLQQFSGYGVNIIPQLSQNMKVKLRQAATMARNNGQAGGSLGGQRATKNVLRDVIDGMIEYDQLDLTDYAEGFNAESEAFLRGF
jgi:hypothetical protein